MRLVGEREAWRQARGRYAGQLLETMVVLDSSGRAIERIDHPRVSFIPTLRYGKPDPGLANWTLLAPLQARSLVVDLDQQHPAFAPHRTVEIQALIAERLAAADQGLLLLEQFIPGPEDDGDAPEGGPRP